MGDSLLWALHTLLLKACLPPCLILPPGFLLVSSYLLLIHPSDPFLNDANFVTCVLILEELGATGNKGLIGFMTSPVLANGVAGLATSATAQATIEVRMKGTKDGAGCLHQVA